MTPVIVIMGVSGAGKTTLGRALARRLSVAFTDADDLHPPASRAKMAAGVALDDDDRKPWLAAVGAVLGEWAAAGEGGVMACSALKRTYRDQLRTAAAGSLRLAFLDLDPATLAERLAARRGHFFNPTLLTSQLDTLEPPQPDEAAIRLSGALSTGQAVAAILEAL